MYSFYQDSDGYYNYHGYRQTQEPSDIQVMKYSAAQLLPVTQEIQQLLRAVAYTPGFAEQLKAAGARGNETRVRQLIREAGVTTPFRVQINPDRIAVIFFAPQQACFGITLSLCW
ncbi:hypothetical protein CVD28_24085 [Bacillus sp. M6-12]|uniref:hypothetical protein n=1 Tax=Bacillus sp. M6-12 TaxID=2054166 RepID=UPI000C78045B|nr:hypothetical protein [Bacillus sp. M6-12]PLS15405.1 hypothetical protein CVD28_24085 [Bacillus sp. M6-12]